MAKCYFELRTQSARGTDSIAADMMRHLHTRQHLGKILVVCDQPIAYLSASRKQWLRLSRLMQKQRASTLNADKILKYTHTIAHMQRMRFTIKTPLVFPEGDVHFLSPASLSANDSPPEQAFTPIPAQCFTVYIAAPLDRALVVTLIAHLPADGLVVDYRHDIDWNAFGLEQKDVLEQRVASAWRQIEQFLNGYDIRLERLIRGSSYAIEAMDDALDILLGASRHFLHIADEFQHALALARPLHLDKTTRLHYDALTLLAHRVQALTPNAFMPHFLEIYNEDDSFLLFDHALDAGASARLLLEGITRHRRAGRERLAMALQTYIMSRPS